MAEDEYSFRLETRRVTTCCKILHWSSNPIPSLYSIFLLHSFSSFSPSKDYHILVQNNNTMSINLTVGIYISSCQFYNKQETWNSAGCEPLDTSTATITVCKCNHLTAFGASVLLAPNAIDFTDLAVSKNMSIDI
jgi:hypothetical protein